uniref:Cadherin domain-containing protein n=1 Tax=Glossina pallidipes TaxID=7398 RepID=A0A1B0A9M8_GLOPL
MLKKNTHSFAHIPPLNNAIYNKSQVIAVDHPSLLPTFRTCGQLTKTYRHIRDRYRLRVRASDRGEPPSYADVDVELDVVDRNNKPPIWDKSIYGPIHIRENVTVGTVVTSVKARWAILGLENHNVNTRMLFALMRLSLAFSISLMNFDSDFRLCDPQTSDITPILNN